MDNFVITIGRRFGSGGRELGSRLARRLGISYYDKELLVEAARKSGMSTEIFERNDERFPRFINGVFSFAQGYLPTSTNTGGSAISSDSVYAAMSDLLHDIAARESCVIVGRTSDYVLRDHPRCVNIFVTAPDDHCVERIMRRGDINDPRKARNMARRINKLRANYYNFYTDKEWGHSSSYDLTFDSSRLPIDDIVEMIFTYLRLRGITVPE